MLQLGLASVGLCQTPEADTLQSLLVEVRRLRQRDRGFAEWRRPSHNAADRTGGIRADSRVGRDPQLGISANVRELHDARRGSARGLIVEVAETPFRQERSFVDADEVVGLINGIDALLNVASSPTEFKNFEIRLDARQSPTDRVKNNNLCTYSPNQPRASLSPFEI
jgi:hypothetical protein